jgi:uncharacterized membrane protein YccC
LIGAGLATLGNLLLWPAWEIQGIQKTLLETIAANRVYLEEIIAFYNKKGKASSISSKALEETRAEYKVCRKQAFLAMSDLSAAFQRMTQEPKSKQKNLDKVYEITVLNHTFLSSLASLSTYILNNPTTPASKNFKKVSSKISQNLSEAERILKKEISETDTENIESENIFESTYGQKIIFSEADKIKPMTDDFHQKLEETFLVREQLKWLLSMSEKMPKLLRETQF